MLFRSLVRQYPHDEDHDYNNEVGAHYVTNRESIAWLKNRVLNQLKERGTSQADTEVKRLIQELPSITWRTRTLIDTQVNRLRKTWQPHQPEQILKLVINQEKRLVQNGQHLLEVLVESLKRLESELQGETPAVRDLWDKVNS